MLATLPAELALTGNWLVSAYWFCLILGGGLLLISVLAGHGSAADAGVDAAAHVGWDTHVDAGVPADFAPDAAHADLPHGAAAHGAAMGLSSWFSLRFVVFFLAAFGAVGVALTHLTPVGAGAVFALALGGGVAVGQGAHQLFRYILRTSGDSAPRPWDYVNKLGRVAVTINGAAKGEVELHVRGGTRRVPAVAADAARRFPAGDEVVVIGYEAGVAQVVSRAEFEQRFRAEFDRRHSGT